MNEERSSNTHFSKASFLSLLLATDSYFYILVYHLRYYKDYNFCKAHYRIPNRKSATGSPCHRVRKQTYRENTEILLVAKTFYLKEEVCDHLGNQPGVVA